MAACFGGHTICTGLLYSTGLIHIALLKKFRADDAKTTWVSAVFIAMMSLAGKLFFSSFPVLCGMGRSSGIQNVFIDLQSGAKPRPGYRKKMSLSIMNRLNVKLLYFQRIIF